MKRNLFDKPVVEWWRGFPVVMPNVWPNKFTKGAIQSVFGNFHFPLEIVWELLRVCFSAGFVEGDQQIPYDGSAISKVVPWLKSKEGTPGYIRLSDLNSLRSPFPVSFEKFLELACGFFQANEDLFCEFSGKNFLEEFRYGVFRLESLFSLFGVEQMALPDYLGYLAANLRNKKQIFGENFAEAHKTSFIPIDHMEGWNTAVFFGSHVFLGQISIGGRIKKVFLTLGPGTGEGYGGVKIALAIEHPAASIFEICADLRKDSSEYLPTILKIQRTPFQLDKELSYDPEFLPHTQFPTPNMLTAIQDEISSQILGGGEVFHTLLVALATFYADLGFDTLMGWPGEENRWLIFHDERKDACREVYTSKYELLGFQKKDLCWHVGLDGSYPELLRRAMCFRRLEQRRVAQVFRELEERQQPTKVSLLNYQQKVTECGLARVVEGLYAMCPHIKPHACGQDMQEVLGVLREIKREGYFIQERERLFLREACNRGAPTSMN